MKTNLISALAIAAFVAGCTPSEMKSATPSFGLGSNDKTVGATLMSAEQMVRSMAAVTKTEINTNLNNEYNARKALMTGSYAVNSVTSPMMISITNLASRFCEATINREAALPAGERRFFGQVDFSKPVANLSPAQYTDAVEKLGLSILGRRPTPDEMAILTEGRGDFENAIPAANKTQAAQTKLLLLFSCSGVLSSFDFITI